MSQKKHEQPHILYYILEIDKTIRNDEYPNSNKLNDKYNWGLSRSTFSRYVEILRSTYNAPLEFDFRKNGYYYSDKTFMLPNVMLAEGELITLSAIMPLLDQYKNTPLEASFKNIIGKITQMLPDNVSVDSSFINNEIHFISAPATYLEEGVFDTILQATKLHKTLKLEYKTAENTSHESREFNPYHILCQNGSWYVIGFSHHSNAIRLYAMPRIKSAEITQKDYTIPSDFKISEHIDPQLGIWHGTGEMHKIEIEFSKKLKAYILERDWHKGQIIKENPDGIIYLSFETNQLNQAVKWVLQFSGDAKVINPPELKEAVKKAAEKILKINS